MKNVKMVKFSKGDWNSFCGCEGEDPEIAYLDSSDFNQKVNRPLSDAVFIADLGCIQIDLYRDYDEDECTQTWELGGLPNQKCSVAICESIDISKSIEDQMKALGFQEI